MPRKKRKRFSEIRDFPNVFDRDCVSGPDLWYREYFGNARSLVLELGCGKGEYTLELARRMPRRSFIGVDKNGARLWKGARLALEEGLSNVCFLRTLVENLPDFFGKATVEEIWIPFPEPLPKRRQAKRRLSSPRQLELYRELLKPGGTVHFKTDDPRLFEYTLETLVRNRCTIDRVLADVDRERENELLQISTTYEKRHRQEGKRIMYLKFAP